MAYIRSVAANAIKRDGVVVRASASQSVDLGFIPLVQGSPNFLDHRPLYGIDFSSTPRHVQKNKY